MITARLFIDFELIERKYEPEMVHATDIFCPVSHRKEQDGYDVLRNDILNNGMKHPIILLPNTYDNWQLTMRHVNPEYIVPYQKTKYICAYGNQRCDILMSSGHTYMWSLITDNVEWSHAAFMELKNST